VWACASAWALLHTAGSIELAVRSAQDPSDPSSLHAAVSRLRWLGLDDADARFRLGVDAGMRGDLSAARQEFERSLLLQETGRGWVGLAHTEFHDGHPEQAQAALLHAVRVEPDDPETWLRASEVWSALGDEGRARDALARAASLAPERADIAARLRTLAASRP
jgi:tetratricopeptide (TPR) repeat protein